MDSHSHALIPIFSFSHALTRSPASRIFSFSHALTRSPASRIFSGSA